MERDGGAERFAPCFTKAERERGARCFANGSVEVDEVGARSITGFVVGLESWRLDIDRQALRAGRLEYRCQCPTWRQRGACHHGWAFVLALEARGWLGPRARRVGRAVLGDTVLTDAAPARAAAAREPGPAAPLSTTSVGGRLTQLRARLLRGRFEQVQQASLRLAIDVAASNQRACLVARPLVVSGAGDGGLEPLGRSDVARLTSQDRALLDRCDSGWGVGDADAHEASGSIVVTGSDLEGVLASLAGRRVLGMDVGGVWRDVDVAPEALHEAGHVVVRLDGDADLVVRPSVRCGRREWALWGLGAHGLALFGSGWILVGGDVVRVVDDKGHWLLRDLVHAGTLAFARGSVDHVTFATLFADLCDSRRHGLPEVSSPARPPRVRVRFAAATDDVGCDDLELLFDYGTQSIERRAPEVALFDGRHLHWRDEAFEADAEHQLVEVCGPVARSEATGRTEHGRRAALAQALLDKGWLVEVEGRRSVSALKVQVRVSSGIDWFDVQAEAECDGARVGLDVLLSALRERRRFVRLHDGNVGLLDAAWCNEAGVLELGMPQPDGARRFQSRQAWMLESLLSERTDGDAGVHIARVRDAARRLGTPASGIVAEGFVGQLRPYQLEGLGWLQRLTELGLGGCLADDMGLGKTVQVLAWLAWRNERRPPGDRRPALVVVPRTLVFNWLDEARRFTPRLRTAVHLGSHRWSNFRSTASADLVVTTYGTLRTDAPRFATSTDVVFDAVVLDEAQQIKNAESQAARAARLVPADQRLALSGTPVENGLHELWSLLEFLNPGLVGRAPAFRQAFRCREREDEARHAAQIARAIRPMFLRRTKADVLHDLPEKSDQIVHVDLPRNQRRHYDRLARSYRGQLLGRSTTPSIQARSFEILTAILRLRQCACHLGLIDPNRLWEPSGKLDVLIPRLVALVERRHKAVVFSQFTSFLTIVSDRLASLGIQYVSLDGTTADRRTPVERFQSDPGVPVMLASLRAGGTGLNLTAADVVFLLDPWWNPAVEAQAVDRAHRIGRVRPVSAIRLVARNTIEERVLELQDSKRALVGALFDEHSGSIANLSLAELEQLLG